MNYDGKRKDLQSFSRKLTPEDSPSSVKLDGTLTNRSESEEAERRKSPGESPSKLSSSNEPRRLTVSVFEATNLQLKLKLRNTSSKPEKTSIKRESSSPENNSISIQDEANLFSPQNNPADDPTTTPVAKISIGSENGSKAEGANIPRVSAVQDGPHPRSSLPQRASQISNYSEPSAPNVKHNGSSVDESGYIVHLPATQRSQSLITENIKSSLTASDEIHAIVGKKQSSTEPVADEEVQTHIEEQIEEIATDAAIIGKNRLSTESGGDESVKPLQNQREDRATIIDSIGKKKLSTESAGDESVKPLQNQREDRATIIDSIGKKKLSTESADDESVKTLQNQREDRATIIDSIGKNKLSTESEGGERVNTLENQPEKRSTKIATETGIPIPKSASLTPTDNPRLSTISNTDSDTIIVGNNPAIQQRPSANTTSTQNTENRTLEQLKNQNMATSKRLNSSESRPFNSQRGSKVDCDCSPCECELPTPPAQHATPKPVPPGFSKYECDCSPCECDSFGPSQTASAQIIDSNLALEKCHCSPCECTIPSTGALRNGSVAHKVDPTDCNCSPCECSYPPSSIVSEAGVVRAPSPIPATCQVRPSNFCNAPCSQMPAPMLRMQSEQVNATPMLQSDQCQTYPPQFPYQAFQQQRPNNLPGYCFASQCPNQQFLPNYQNNFSPQGHFHMDNGAPPLVCPPEGNNAQWALPNNFNNVGQYLGVYPTPVGFGENQSTHLTASAPAAYRNSWVNRIPFAPKPEDHRDSFMLTANYCGYMNPSKTNTELRDCSEQTECCKDASSYCSSTRRRKSSAVKAVTNGCQDTKSPELVLVREVYHFKKASKAQCCGSRKTLSNATSSLCCRPRWTNAYKYHNCNPFVSKVRPPRPPTLAPCPVCKGCDCICNDDHQQSSSCSYTSSKHNQPSRSCLSNGCCEKVAKKASCGCELVKMPKGPVSLVREFLIQGSGLPLHLQGLCGAQQSPPLQQQQQQQPEVKGQTNTNNNSTSGQPPKGNERKSNALLTVSRVPVLVEEDSKRISHGSVSRRASQRRSTIQRKKSVRNSKDSALVENKTNNNQISSENNEQNVAEVEHDNQNVMESKGEDVTETEKEPIVEVVVAADTNDEGLHKRRRKRKGDKDDDDEPDSQVLKQTPDDHTDELDDDTPWRSNDLDEYQEPEADVADESPTDHFANVRSQFFDT